MNARKCIATITAAAALGAVGFASPVTTLATAQQNTDSVNTTWTKVWQTTIGSDYFEAHPRGWLSGTYGLPEGSQFGRAVFSCTGGGGALLQIKNHTTGKVVDKKHDCDGARHHTPLVAWRKGQSLQIGIDSTKTVVVEAWAGKN